MKIPEIMTSEVKTILHDASVLELARMLDEYGISGLPVVDHDGRLVGVVSRSDISAGVSDPPPASTLDMENHEKESTLLGLEHSKVADIMTESVVTVESHQSVAHLARMMVDDGVHRVFVTSGEELVGVVSAIDLVRVLGEVLEGAKV